MRQGYRVVTLLAAFAAGPAFAASPATPGPESALARFLSAPRGPSWRAEVVDIEASLPKLGKQGRFRAVKISTADGRPEYRDLTLEGDRTVRQQVIARYLSAEAAAADLPSSSVAFTPSNYRFRYRGSIQDGSGLVYIFDVTPRKKRTGLIRGQLWIDATRSVVRRQTGRLVRVPSIFLRRVSITRDTALRCGSAWQVTTHVEIETRLVGRAELTIIERPYQPQSDSQSEAEATQPQVDGN